VSPPAAAGDTAYDLWGSRLSPFVLKVAAMCAHVGVRCRRLPAEGGLRDNLRADARCRRLRAGKLELTWPPMSELDELPLVPFLFGPRGENLYDSSAIAGWLDRHHECDRGALVPAAAAPRMIARLIDEYFDEFGLYMVHHNRWVLSAATNDAGRRLAGEFATMIVPPLRPLMAAWFSARQVRRLPYLFSVAPAGFAVAGVARRRQPPSPMGFPETHGLLDDAFLRMLAAMEEALGDQPYLLGSRFTVADASAYGQLAMNTQDRSADGLIAARAPRTHAWVMRIASGDNDGAGGDAGLVVGARLEPLLAEIARTFVPLMRQNESAYAKLRAGGQGRFNEKAFDRGEALYDGELDGRPFRSVAKTFQVAVWRRLKDEWRALDDGARAACSKRLNSRMVCDLDAP